MICDIRVVHIMVSGDDRTESLPLHLLQESEKGEKTRTRTQREDQRYDLWPFYAFTLYESMV